jgi:hypothetical protein
MRASRSGRDFRCVGNGAWSDFFIRAGLGELHVGPALVHFQPAALDRQIEPREVFGRRGLVLKQHRPLINSMWIRPS